MTKIGIIDADLLGRKKHRFPNLACEKISGFWKSKGAEVRLLLDYNFGTIYGEYAKSYIRQHNTDYTRMIKEEIDYSLLQANHSSAVSMYEHMSHTIL